VNIRLRYKLGLLATIVLWAFLQGRSCAKPKPKSPAVLPANDTEQITVDPSRHIISILTPAGRRTETLPDRPSTIDVRKDGTVKVTSSQMGLERHWFVGVVGADHARVGVGVDGLYFKRLDLGVGIAGQLGSYDPVGFAKLTYSVKGNLQLGLVYQNNQYIGGILAVRIF
jgi:hypothetical protein